jgi:hypothetical protein
VFGYQPRTSRFGGWSGAAQRWHYYRKRASAEQHVLFETQYVDVCSERCQRACEVSLEAAFRSHLAWVRAPHPHMVAPPTSYRLCIRTRSEGPRKESHKQGGLPRQTGAPLSNMGEHGRGLGWRASWQEYCPNCGKGGTLHAHGWIGGYAESGSELAQSPPSGFGRRGCGRTFAIHLARFIGSVVVLTKPCGALRATSSPRF